MSVDFDSFSNRGEYFSAHYFAEQLGADLKKGLFATWAIREGDQHDPRETPRELLPGLRRTYMREEVRSYFAECARLDADDDVLVRADRNPEWEKRIREWHQDVLRALGFRDSSSTSLRVHRSGREHEINVAYHGHGIVALDCGWAAENDAALDADGAGRLLTPLRVSGSEAYEFGAALASWLFHSNLYEIDADPPRFVLLLVGGVIVLADRNNWGEGRYLAANLDAALERNDRRQGGELATIAALFSLEMLRPDENDMTPLIDSLLKASRDNAVGVSGELRHGLQRSVEIIANEVLSRLEEAGVTPNEVARTTMSFAAQLTQESLRYLYRILFLLYAEARPELGILPSDDGTYEAGYSMARLRELVARDEQLTEEAARNGFHLFESLSVLFANVNGHRHYGTEPHDDQSGDDETTRDQDAREQSKGRGLRFEPLHSELFDPKSILLIGGQTEAPWSTDDEPALLDLRLRNSALQEVLRLLTMKEASRRGGRGGFISYRNLGINQLGSVYEGLMSYTGFIAEEELCEVAKKGKHDNGSWLIPAWKQELYPDEVFIHYREEDERKGLRGRKKYPHGSFVYRLAGRDRETSASYYTPESLTSLTVELALKRRLDQERDDQGNEIKTRAAELLKYKICEPALGSGAFLNEAINQVADEYLKRRQEELGVSIPTSRTLAEKQKVKAYIALHNSYGVDLNATGVELAEVSLWLNTMHPGMLAPWFGLHLRRGNSLIGARRAVYSGGDVASKEKLWLKGKGTLAPTELPFLQDGERQDLPAGAIHQFLLPTPGWAAVAGEKEAKELAPEQAARLRKWRSGICKVPSAKKPRGGKRSQLERLQAVAQRAEFLWGLVHQRMEISEWEISRKIDLWGSDPEDPEYSFVRRPQTAVKKEKVYRDLFEMTGTPYWRLKTLMDTWCALWFWPVHKAGLLDGTDEGTYAADAAPEGAAVFDELPQVEIPEQVAQASLEASPDDGYTEPMALFNMAAAQGSLFAESTEDAGLASSAPVRNSNRTTPKTPKAPVRRARIPLTDLEDWIDFAEALIGAHDVPEETLIKQFSSLDELADYEDWLPTYMGMDPAASLPRRFPWLDDVHGIADEQGFLHWELEFARIFGVNGGFDLQVGNPPWVRPEWDESAVLAEFEPWFKLTEKASATDKTARKDTLLRENTPCGFLLRKLAETAATSTFLSSAHTYPLLNGMQPDLYRGFMCQTWAHASGEGVIGLVHPDTHFSGDKEALLREAAYARLRTHGDFVNVGNRFFPPPVGRSSHFGLHVYAKPQEINFFHLSWLFSADALRISLDGKCSDSDPEPGVRLAGTWDERAHPKRVVTVDREKLAEWKKLTGDLGQPLAQTRLLSPVSTAEDQAISALANYSVRLGDWLPQISRGFDEAGAKNQGIIEYNSSYSSSEVLHQAESWAEVVLKGPQISTANPLFKQPSQGGGELLGPNLTEVDQDFIPETEYRRSVTEEQYFAEQDRWIDHRILDELRSSEVEVAKARATAAALRRVADDEVNDEEIDRHLIDLSRRPYTDFYRVAWREMVAPDTERSLYAALLPPGPAHVHSVRSMSLRENRHTALTAGFWSSIPIDYLLRSTGIGHLDVSRANQLPVPAPGHPLASALLLRTLRLNSLTSAYANLWSELYDDTWSEESWAYDWPGLQPLNQVTPTWQYDTPLRTERARRAALVELDALVAVWLGVDKYALGAMYRARFPVLQDFDAVTLFDAHERKIAGNRYTYGHGQTKEHYQQLVAHREAPQTNPPPEDYTPPFYEADRGREMKKSHEVFQARLDAAVERGEWDPERQEVPER